EFIGFLPRPNPNGFFAPGSCATAMVSRGRLRHNHAGRVDALETGSRRRSRRTILMRTMRFIAAAVGAIALAGQPAAGREIIAFSGYSAGTIVIRTAERRLYYVIADGRAIRYPVGVGRLGKQWAGTSEISGKYLHPAWSPPAEIRHDKPSL